MGKIHGHEDQRRYEHAAESSDEGKRAVRPGIELPLNHLPLDLEPDQEKEKGHQSIVDPMQEIEAADRRMQHRFVIWRERRIGHGEAERRAPHQHDADRGL